MLALLVDWFASMAVVLLFVGPDSYFGTGSSDQWWTLLVFVLESALLTCTVGGSFGKVATRLRVVRVGTGRVDRRALARAAGDPGDPRLWSSGRTGAASTTSWRGRRPSRLDVKGPGQRPVLMARTGHGAAAPPSSLRKACAPGYDGLRQQPPSWSPSPG